MNIVTIDCAQCLVLRTKADQIQEDEWPLALEIVDKLFSALKPYFPAAGLAAPQIGISKAVFIYSFDRNPDHLEAVINPTFIPLVEAPTERWEGCFSTILCQRDWKLANVSRYDRIKAVFLNQQRELKVKILEGFAARVFQHEYDHLQGIVNIDKGNVKSFDSKDEMKSFLQAAKAKDAEYYITPKEEKWPLYGKEAI